ncbi:MAG: SURF1 family protein [Gammaproteobacteria bacterium]
MQIGIWNFRPSLWPTLATLLSLPLLFSLGNWQLDRAAEKEQVQKDFEANYYGAAFDLNENSTERLDPAQMEWKKVIVRGSFETDHQFILDNQPMNFKTGYLVFTPFKLENESTRILINRGWVPANPDRRILPKINDFSTGLVTISGAAKKTPFSGIELSDDLIENLENGLSRVQQIDLQNVESTTGQTFLPYIVRLDKQSPQGYLRDWVLPGFGAEKHYGYAFQWFAMTAALIIIYLVVNIKRVRNDD